MTRKIIPILVALALGYPQGAPALALGDLKVRSSLNEPFNAEIDLLSVRGDDLADAGRRTYIDVLQQGQFLVPDRLATHDTTP